MRFLVDECFPMRLVRAFSARGDDAVWGGDVCRSQPDEAVLAYATSDGRIVVTEDRDYGKLVIALDLPAIGIVIAHSSEFPGGIAEVIDALAERIHTLDASLPGMLTTIEPTRTRQRPLHRS